jgi:predicted DNA-binding protein (UPF0278 family)
MSNIIYLQEERIKRGLKTAEDALQEARSMVVRGVDVPTSLIGDLENIISTLEKKLEDYLLETT